MKRPTKHLSDMDLNGRVRRHPVCEATQPVEAKFLDGPVAGTTRLAPRGADYVKVGSWTYSYAGKQERVPLYCKLPKSRRDRSVLMFVIGKRGSDPRVDMAGMRQVPAKRTAPPAQGRGARRRAEKRAHAAA